MLLLVGITMRVQFISELIGTFCMVFIGCLAVKEGQGGPVISLAFGGAVCAVIIVSRRFSGAHINPAVSIAFAITGELDRRELPVYIAAQIIGGLVAGFLIGEFGATEFSVNFNLGITIEIFITFALMMSIYLTIWHTDNDVMVGVIVGIVVALLAFYFGPYTGASMNPARTIGPNLASNVIEIIPIYLISTVTGAILAALICLKLRKSIQKPEAFN